MNTTSRAALARHVVWERLFPELGVVELGKRLVPAATQLVRHRSSLYVVAFPQEKDEIYCQTAQLWRTCQGTCTFLWVSHGWPCGVLESLEVRAFLRLFLGRSSGFLVLFLELGAALLFLPAGKLAGKNTNKGSHNEQDG